MTVNIQAVDPESIRVRITAEMTLAEGLKVVEAINTSPGPYHGTAYDFAAAIFHAVTIASERMNAPLGRK